jgi:hypothetical protein
VFHNKKKSIIPIIKVQTEKKSDARKNKEDQKAFSSEKSSPLLMSENIIKAFITMQIVVKKQRACKRGTV